MNRFLSSTARGGSSLFSHATTSASAVVSVSATASSSGSALRCTAILAARRLSSVASSSNDHDDDDSIKVGTVKNFGLKGGFGFIIPDGVDKRTHHAKDLIFIHRNDILVNASETKTGETRYYPR
jgi:cold shock CspA family protein